MNSFTNTTILKTLDLNASGKISDIEAALNIVPKEIDSILYPYLKVESINNLKGFKSNGITASPGSVIGNIFFTPEDALQHYKKSKALKTNSKIILALDELQLTDLYIFGIIDGLITKKGSLASHTAILAKAHKIPCIVGYQSLNIFPELGFMQLENHKILSQTTVTLSADSLGKFYIGKGELQDPTIQNKCVSHLNALISKIFAANNLPLQVKLNSNNLDDINTGLNFGADGVGLLRTENMFDDFNEIKQILNPNNDQQHAKDIEQFEKSQYNDFLSIFQALNEKPINIRLLSIPSYLQIPINSSKYIYMKNIYEAQICAIIQATYSSKAKLVPGIMLPHAVGERDLTDLTNTITRIDIETRNNLAKSGESKVSFKVGAMVESPRGALCSDALATVGEFFAFGTNDLTESTMGISRDKGPNSLRAYLDEDIFNEDPYQVLASPVKELINIAIKRANNVRSDVEFGICGEQGSDPSTISFCLDHGLSYVSCSPYKILPTKLALIHHFWG